MEENNKSGEAAPANHGRGRKRSIIREVLPEDVPKGETSMNFGDIRSRPGPQPPARTRPAPDGKLKSLSVNGCPSASLKDWDESGPLPGREAGPDAAPAAPSARKPATFPAGRGAGEGGVGGGAYGGAGGEGKPGQREALQPPLDLYVTAQRSD